jgi:hypothetical protein
VTASKREPCPPGDADLELQLIIMEELATFLQEGTATHVVDPAAASAPVPVDRLVDGCRVRIAELRRRRPPGR